MDFCCISWDVSFARAEISCRDRAGHLRSYFIHFYFVLKFLESEDLSVIDVLVCEINSLGVKPVIQPIRAKNIYKSSPF